ncbi:MAG: class I SAM-dependent methyltransferase [Gemmatimonadales bacterium]
MAAHRTRFPARWRDYYNDLMLAPAWLNLQRWRLQLRLFGLRRPAPVLVNLGCGKDYRPGYVNVDINVVFRRDLWLDLRQPLPFVDGTIDGIFCSHVLEHFPLDQTSAIARECRRVLQPDGVLRVGVPDVEPAIQAYQRGDLAYLRGEGRSRGRRFSDHVLDNSNHKLLFDYEFLEELLTDAGFREVRRCGFRAGSWPLSERMAELDNREEITVFAEALR